jgi:hypothetical protein
MKLLAIVADNGNSANEFIMPFAGWQWCVPIDGGFY